MSPFNSDRRRQRLGAAGKAVWWGAAGLAARTLARSGRTAPGGAKLNADPVPPGFVRKAWLEAFEKDRSAVASGLYPAMDDEPPDLAAMLDRTIDLIADARAVEARRAREGGQEARAEAPSSFPAYYRQNFHFQTGGWFTEASARRYEAQVEALFSGAAGAMRRTALALLAGAWRDRDHRGARIADIACGSGAFLGNLARAFPRTQLIGIDLSPAYLAEAARRVPTAQPIQASAERLPFADSSLEAIACIYLFHELPPKARAAAAAEFARVLRPGGLLAFADSLQMADEPRLARLLEAFPAYFHEPYYASFTAMDLGGLYAGLGLRRVGEERAFLTKALLFEKPV